VAHPPEDDESTPWTLQYQAENATELCQSTDGEKYFACEGGVSEILYRTFQVGSRIGRDRRIITGAEHTVGLLLRLIDAETFQACQGDQQYEVEEETDATGKSRSGARQSFLLFLFVRVTYCSLPFSPVAQSSCLQLIHYTE